MLSQTKACVNGLHVCVIAAYQSMARHGERQGAWLSRGVQSVHDAMHPLCC